MTDIINKQENDLIGKKILLVLLPFWTPLIPPQGISRIKGFLQDHGYEVKTVDVNLENEFRRSYDKYFDTLSEYLPIYKRGNFYNIGNDVWREHMMAHINYDDKSEYIELVKIVIYKTFYTKVDDKEVEQLIEIIDKFYIKLEKYFLDLLDREKPGVLGLSVYRDTLASSLFIFKLTKKKYPYIKTIMGGGIFTIQLVPGSPNLNFFLEKTKHYIDKIIIGTGEHLLLKYLKGELPELQRVYTRKDIGGSSPGISSVDLPDLSDFESHDYYYLAAQGSIGCPFQCSFCNVGSVYGKYRNKSARQTVEEMTTLSRKYRLQLFYMLDALLNPIITGIANEFIKSGVTLYWDGYFRVDKRACNIENALLWRRGGFYRARIGVESGSQRVLDLMGKKITLEQTKATISNLARSGIKTTLYIVIGHPGETEEDFQQTLQLIEELKNDIWEAECNPFTYIYSGQGNSCKWADKRVLLYPGWAKDLLISQTWIVECKPSREEMYSRIYRFVEHCKRLDVSTPWTLKDVNKADERWKRLHKNAVPSVLDLSTKGRYFDECKKVNILNFAGNGYLDESDFNF